MRRAFFAVVVVLAAALVIRTSPSWGGLVMPKGDLRRGIEPKNSSLQADEENSLPVEEINLFYERKIQSAETAEQFQSRSQARVGYDSILETLAAQGMTRVWFADLVDVADNEKYPGMMIVEMPQSPTQRTAAHILVTTLRLTFSHDPVFDRGQRYFGIPFPPPSARGVGFVPKR